MSQKHNNKINVIKHHHSEIDIDLNTNIWSVYILTFSMLITANNGTVTLYKWISNVWLHKIHFFTAQKQKTSILTTIYRALIMHSTLNENNNFTWMNDHRIFIFIQIDQVRWNFQIINKWQTFFLCVEAILLLYPVQQSNEKNQTVKRREKIINRIITVRWQDNTTVLKVQWPIQFRWCCCYYYWVQIRNKYMEW